MKAAVAPDELAKGTPVEVVAEGEQFTYAAGFAPSLGIYNGTLRHYKDDMVFVQLDALNKDEVVPITVAVKKTSKPFRVLFGKANKALQDQIFSHYRKNLGVGLSGALPMNMGSDPELFFEGEDGKLIPAFEALPDKKTPARSGGNSMYWDGFQAEFTTKPESCLAFHVDSIQSGLKAIVKKFREKFPKARPSLQNVFEIEPKMLREGKEEHIALGCDPSKNIYGIGGIAVQDGRRLPLRFAGGHVHMGIGKFATFSEIEQANMVKACDAIAGVGCVSLFDGIDNAARREFYGLPGEHRTPAHGLEYRTLSNAWLSHPAITHLVFDTVRESARVGYKSLLRFWEGSEQEIRDIILGCDVKAARKMWTANKAFLLSMFRHIYNGTHTREHYGQDVTDKVALAAFNTFGNGLDFAVKDPKDIEGNWLLKTGQTWLAHSEGAAGQWYKVAKELPDVKKN